ncbi:hypothetical protein, partial [Shewanella sp. 10N.286.52.B9]|uniref:hypothetical protein n=1 Tax=Shewanella sp. 10N.286.52.B9 TaxID=1880837 RepID=UPI001054AA8D
MSTDNKDNKNKPNEKNKLKKDLPENKIQQAIKKIDNDAKKLRAKESRDTGNITPNRQNDLVADKSWQTNIANASEDDKATEADFTHAATNPEANPEATQQDVLKTSTTPQQLTSSTLKNASQIADSNPIEPSQQQPLNKLIVETGSTQTTGLAASAHFHNGNVTTQDISQFRTSQISLPEQNFQTAFTINSSSHSVSNVITPQTATHDVIETLKGTPTPDITPPSTGTGTGT